MLGGLIFSVAVVGVTGLLFKYHARMESAELMTYVAIIAWASFAWGMLLMRQAA